VAYVLQSDAALKMANVIDAEASVGNKSCKKLIEASKCKSMTEWMLLKKGLENRIPVRFQDEDGKILGKAFVWPRPGRQTIRHGDDEYEIWVGELSGTSKKNPYERLVNLGYYNGPVREDPDSLEAAVAFQERHELEKETTDKLRKFSR